MSRQGALKGTHVFCPFLNNFACDSVLTGGLRIVGIPEGQFLYISRVRGGDFDSRMGEC